MTMSITHPTHTWNMPWSTQMTPLKGALAWQRLACGAYETTCMAASKACEKSALMSSSSSKPTEMRMPAGLTFASSCCAAVSCWWVVADGWMTSVRASPTLARCAHILSDEMNFCERFFSTSGVSPGGERHRGQGR